MSLIHQDVHPVLHVVCLYSHIVIIFCFRAFTNHLGISVHNVKQRVSEKLHSIRLIFFGDLLVIVLCFLNF